MAKKKQATVKRAVRSPARALIDIVALQFREELARYARQNN
jgi:hypothetical protein